MVRTCSVLGYQNSDRNPPDRKVIFFSFSSDNALLKKWIDFINLENWGPTKTLKICSDHFRKEFINSKGPRLEKYAYPGMIKYL